MHQTLILGFFFFSFSFLTPACAAIYWQANTASTAVQPAAGQCCCWGMGGHTVGNLPHPTKGHVLGWRCHPRVLGGYQQPMMPSHFSAVEEKLAVVQLQLALSKAWVELLAYSCWLQCCTIWACKNDALALVQKQNMGSDTLRFIHLRKNILPPRSLPNVVSERRWWLFH